MNDESQSRGWWRTVPGILTAIAGTITAVTGLIVALHQAGIFDASRQKASQVQNEGVKPSKVNESPVPKAPGATKPSSGSQAASYPIKLPEGTQTRVGDLVYKILTARIERYDPNKLSLRLEVRMINNGRFPANFWASSFRLLVDGAPRAPGNGLDEVVDSHSAKEGVIEFVIPDNISEVGLQMGEVGEGAPTITISLRTAKR